MYPLSRAALARAQLRQMEAESQIRSASAALSRSMAVAQGATYDPELPDLNIGVTEPLPKLLVEAFSQRPELRALGRVLTRSSAVLRMLSLLGFPFSLTAVFRLIPAGLRDAVYDFIARSSIRWFGRMHACRLPSPSERHRLL